MKPYHEYSRFKSKVSIALLSRHHLQGTLFTFSLLLAALSSSAAVSENYIVRLTQQRAGRPGELLSHRDYLEKVLGSPNKVDQSLIYGYKNVFNGFAAKLTEEQVARLSKMEGVLSVVPNTRFVPATTSTWKFLGLESTSVPDTGAVWSRAKYGEDVIIGVVDTGIWPESWSFKDTGLSSVPAKWKGNCVEGSNFTKSHCNKKLIGARYYYAGNPQVDFTKDYKSARDNQGHGTHVASTAAGFFAPAHYYGYANGTAKGGAPKARLAVYKVCWADAACYEADMVAAIDDAISDGVDIISISISGSNDRPLYEDSVSIASFQAMRSGILVNFAGGNAGPGLSTVNHVEPWSFTVAATTHDRLLGADVVIQTPGSETPENGLQFKGATMSDYPAITAPIVLGSQAAYSPYPASYCWVDSLDPSLVSGKIVFCLRGRRDEDIYSKGEVVREAGGVGMIVGNGAGLEDHTVELNWLYIPMVHVTARESQRIIDYLTECDQDTCVLRNVTATISKGTTFLGSKPAPVIAYFSSCGPSGVTKDILKPDVSAPGVDILAAWYSGSGPNAYTMISGTSMATPHVAGITALVKAVHPDWSPSAIKSAVMTSAVTTDNTKARIKNHEGKAAGAFSMGSGFVNPVAAVDPGLVYEANWRDYALFLCSLNYTNQEVELITGEIGFCTGKAVSSPSDLNYPSLAIGDLTSVRTVTRRVTNVGKAFSLYVVSVEAPRGVRVTVTPSQLVFTKTKETKSFTVRLERTEPVDGQESYVFGRYTWSDGSHRVSSPIVVGCRSRSFDEMLVMGASSLSSSVATGLYTADV